MPAKPTIPNNPNAKKPIPPRQRSMVRAVPTRPMPNRNVPMPNPNIMQPMQQNMMGGPVQYGGMQNTNFANPAFSMQNGMMPQQPYGMYPYMQSMPNGFGPYYNNQMPALQQDSQEKKAEVDAKEREDRNQNAQNSEMLQSLNQAYSSMINNLQFMNAVGIVSGIYQNANQNSKEKEEKREVEQQPKHEQKEIDKKEFFEEFYQFVKDKMNLNETQSNQVQQQKVPESNIATQEHEEVQEPINEESVQEPIEETSEEQYEKIRIVEYEAEKMGISVNSYLEKVCNEDFAYSFDIDKLEILAPVEEENDEIDTSHFEVLQDGDAVYIDDIEEDVQKPEIEEDEESLESQEENVEQPQEQPEDKEDKKKEEITKEDLDNALKIIQTLMGQKNENQQERVFTPRPKPDLNHYKQEIDEVYYDVDNEDELFDDNQYMVQESEFDEVEETISDEEEFFEEPEMLPEEYYMDQEPEIIQDEPEPEIIEEISQPEMIDEDSQVENGKQKKEVVEKSFVEKVQTADSDIQSIYNEIKNELLSYKGIKSRFSSACESYRKAREMVAKFVIIGRTMKLYLALDPSSLSDNIYHQKDESKKKAYKEVPFMVKIKSPLSIRKAKELIAIAMERQEVVKNAKYENQDYVSQLVDIDGLEDE